MTPTSRFVSLPCALPTTSIPEQVDPIKVAKSLPDDLRQLDATHLAPDAIWRDLFALTGTTRTFYSAGNVAEAWKETTTRGGGHSFNLKPQSAQVIRLPNGSSWIQAAFTFETETAPAAICNGFLSLVPEEDGSWKVWVLRTVLDQLKGIANVDHFDPPPAASGANGALDPTAFDCVVVGGGTAGLSTAGRLKALGISYAVLDKHSNVGDSWKKRYRSARLHTTREYSHLPFNRTFPSEYQEWLTKDDLARGYQDWVKKFDINIWLGTTLLSGSWDNKARSWSLNCERGEGKLAITCKHLVLALGAGSQAPKIPQYPGMESFEGTMIHSADFQDASEWGGKHAIVVGTANTAHDVAEDMQEAGCSTVTMIQRSRTCTRHVPLNLLCRLIPIRCYAVRVLSTCA